jgi:hypothetical protein
MKRHLACNYIRECVGGEDEEACKYTRCGQGGFLLHGRCYILRKTIFHMNSTRHPEFTKIPSPEEAALVCSRVSADLASLSSSGEFQRVTAKLYQKQFFKFHVGIIFMQAGLPHM